MSVRLLLEENLSERLLPLLFDRFPDSRHVRLLGLGGADDLAIWDWARCDGDLLRSMLMPSEAFSSHPEAGFLVLSPGAKP